MMNSIKGLNMPASDISLCEFHIQFPIIFSTVISECTRLLKVSVHINHLSKYMYWSCNTQTTLDQLCGNMNILYSQQGVEAEHLLSI